MRLGALLVLAGMGMAAAHPARAEDLPPAKPGDGAAISPLDLLGSVVDGVGGALKVLVGPPVSSPSPYLNMPGDTSYLPKPAPQPQPAAVAVPAPQPAREPAAPATLPTPIPTSPTSPPEAAAAVSPPPTPAPRPKIAAPKIEPVPTAPAQPTCFTRAAPTATPDQAARLPRCLP